MPSPYGMTVGGLLNRDLVQPIKRFATTNPLDAAAIATMPVPIVGDVTGLLADANMYYNEPEERTLVNAGLSSLGILPFVPSVAAVRAAKKYGGDPRLIKNPAVIREEMAQKKPTFGFGGQIGNLVHRPLDEMQSTFVPTPGGLLAPKVTTAEDLAAGGDNVLINLVGDKTRAGGVVTEIGNNKLETPVDMQGGFQYGQSRAQMDDESMWASAGGIPQGIQNQIDEAGREADNVYLSYVSMGGASDAVSHHMADALLEQIKVGKITKKAKKAFDSHLRNIKIKNDKTNKIEQPLKDWPGLDSPNISEYVAELPQGPTGVFTKAMDKRSWMDMGFPDVAETRLAITDPELLGLPSGYGGQFIGRGRVGSAVEGAPSYQHKTYPNTIKGDYVGGLAEPLPRQVMFPDFHQARRAAGKAVVPDDRAFNIGAPQVQKLDQEWLDGVMQYYDDLEAGIFD
jgi:hypothetical protein